MNSPGTGSEPGPYPDEITRAIGCLRVGLNILFVVFLALSGWYAYGTWSFVQKGGVADGIVVALEAHSGSDGTFYTSAIEYRVGDERYEITDIQRFYEVDQVVRVRYDRDDPSQARIDDFWGLWFLPVLFIMLSVLFGLLVNGYLNGFLEALWFVRLE